MPPMPINAAILFEPEAYVLDGPKLMGRQAAGNAYLRAAVQGRGGETLSAYSPRKQSGDVFARLVRDIDARATTQWIPATRLDLVAAAGSLHLPGPVLGEAANLRLRAGPAAYSLTGVTHTTASHAAMDAVAGLLSQPLMPWDALISTSKSVLSTIETVLGAERDYLRWRYGSEIKLPMPQLPVIPLGVHCGDFAFDAGDRAHAREALGLAEDEVVALFVGRLSFHAKAHPAQMYLGLEAAAKRSGKKIVLLQCGWFANEAIERAFKEGAHRHCPGVRAIFSDGRNEEVRRRSWAAADIFVSLSDNVQETFGLAPVEAMAAGLPVVATDWDGYKDTIRDGVDGFLIPTTMPAPGAGGRFAFVHEAGEANYDTYCGLICRTVSVDAAALEARLTELAGSPELRRRLGLSGRARARAEFDWSLIYRRYQELWAELGRIRGRASSDPKLTAWISGAPKAASGRLDPFQAFAHYPTRLIGLETLVSVVPGSDAARYGVLAADPLFSYAPEALPSEALAGAMLDMLRLGPVSLQALAEKLNIDPRRVVTAIAILAKMGLVCLAWSA